MAFESDPRYDMRLIDSPDGETIIDEIPLVLREAGGSLDFNVALSSPFYGRLPEGDDLEDKDNSRFQVLTQRDWRGGLGQEHAYEDPAAFLSGVMDTRFRNAILLPPSPTSVSIAAATDPQFTPDTAGVVQGTKTVEAKWTKRDDSDAESEASALWTQTQHQYLPSGTTGVAFGAGTGRVALAKRLVVGDAGFTLSTLSVELSRLLSASGESLSIMVYSDAAGVPGSLLFGSAILDSAISASGSFSSHTVSPGLSLTANTTYWIVCYYVGSTNTFYWRSSNADGTETIAAYSTSWTTTTDQRVSYQVNGGAAVDHVYTRVQLAQSFTATAISATQLQLYVRASQWGTAPTVEVHLCADSAGSPDLASPLRTVALPNPGTSAAWSVLAISSLSLTGGATYWIVISVAATSSANATRVQWRRDSGSGYSGGAGQTRSLAGGVWGAWGSVSGDHYFIVNTLAAAHPYFYTHTYSSTAYSVWVQPSSTVTLVSLRLWLKLNSWAANATLTLHIRADSSNVPGSTINSVSLTQAGLSGVTTALGWVVASISASLTAGVKYHIAIEANAPAVGDAVSLDWGCDTGGGVWSGQGSEGLSASLPGAVFSWSGAKAHDFFFILNNGTSIASSFTVQPIRFSGQWYAAAGANIYRFNTGTGVFDLVYSAAANVTALAHLAGSIYAALGDANDMVASTTGNSGTWSAVSGSRRYTYLRAYAGYLYCAKAAGGANALAYTNGSTWSSGLTVSTSDAAITGLAGFQNEVLILTTRGLFALSSEYVYQVMDWSNEEEADNGRNSLVWMRDGRLYVPVRAGLNAWNGAGMESVGPDQEEGLPLGQQGRIAAMVGTRNWLFAAVDAGASGTSGIYAYNGQGWHCLALGTAVGRRIRAIGVESVTGSTVRLWWWEDGTPYYVALPTLSDNPYQMAGAQYASTGTLTSCKMGGRLALLSKDFHSIALWTDNCSAGRTVQVWIEVDSSGVWVQVGTITAGPYTEIRLPMSTFATKTVAVGSTAQVINVSGSTSDMAAGNFVRIGAEVAQVASVNSGTQFTLARSLAEVPAAGAVIYPSGPAGRQVRYRLVLSTNDATQTPRVIRVSLRMQAQVLAKARLSFGPRIEDGLQLRTGAEQHPLLAAEMRDRLFEWAQRLKSFWLVDPMGRNWLVKPAALSESAVKRRDLETVNARFQSMMRIEVDEV